MTARNLIATLIALAISAAHFASFDIFTQPIITDVRFFLYYAWQVSEGAVAHLDFFENKPQLSTFAGAVFYKLGDLLGVDPLMAIRTGYLGIAATGGVLIFWIFRHLGRGSTTVGILGLLAYCSFGLIGVLASIGIIPKLLMAVLASAMALLVYDRRWFLAGACGAFAFMDWQIGAIIWLAAFISAAVFERPRRPAMLSTLAGGFAGMAPFLLYYAANGALMVTFKQVIVSTFFRGSAALKTQSLEDRIDHITGLVPLACPEQGWVFFASFLGLLCIGRWLIWNPGRDRMRLLLPLYIYHGCILSFSLLDFQLYGDFFILTHSVAFLGGLAWLSVHEAGTAALSTRFPGNRVALQCFTVLILVGAVSAARPSFLRPDLWIRSSTIKAGGTLADQREVAAKIQRKISGKTFAVFDSSELLFLMRHQNPLPHIYMNRATRSYLKIRPDETNPEIGSRLLKSIDPDIFIESRILAKMPTPFIESYGRMQISSKNKKYRIPLRVRRKPGSRQ